MTLGELAKRSGGALQHGSSDAEFRDFALDNREVRPGDVFIAIQGANVDGHQFVPAAALAGAICVLVEKPTDSCHILVDDVTEAIAKLGNSLRNEFDGPVVGTTGSNGKTSAKEFLAVALSARGPVLKSEGNRNTELTSPLVWHHRQPEHWAAVIEMSMRGLGQIKHLCDVHQPTHGLITNIGVAHIELLGNREGIAKAKGELLEALPEAGTAFLWAEDPYLGKLVSMTSAKVLTYGESPTADAQVVHYAVLDLHAAQVKFKISGQEVESTLPTVGRHQAINAAGALLAACTLGVDPQCAAEQLSHAKLPAMRMEHRLHKGADVLMDNYNASPDSMKAALRTLMELPCKGRRIAVIGEMRELGKHAEEAHRELGGALVLEEPDCIILYGPLTRPAAEVLFESGYPASNLCLATSLDDVRAFLDRVQPGDLVLVKGSRALGMEEALAP